MTSSHCGLIAYQEPQICWPNPTAINCRADTGKKKTFQKMVPEMFYCLRVNAPVNARYLSGCTTVG